MFEKQLQKQILAWLYSAICPSVCMEQHASHHMDSFYFINFIFGIFNTICQYILSIVTNGQTRDTAHEDLCTFTSHHCCTLEARHALFLVGYELSLKKAADDLKVITKHDRLYISPCLWDIDYDQLYICYWDKGEKNALKWALQWPLHLDNLWSFVQPSAKYTQWSPTEVLTMPTGV